MPPPLGNGQRSAQQNRLRGVLVTAKPCHFERSAAESKNLSVAVSASEMILRLASLAQDDTVDKSVPCKAPESLPSAEGRWHPASPARCDDGGFPASTTTAREKPSGAARQLPFAKGSLHSIPVCTFVSTLPHPERITFAHTVYNICRLRTSASSMWSLTEYACFSRSPQTAAVSSCSCNTPMTFAQRSSMA